MVNLTIEQVHELTTKIDQIRHVAIIGAVDHGKSTFVDSLVRETGIIPFRSTGFRLMERAYDDYYRRDSSISIDGVRSLYYELPESSPDFVKSCDDDDNNNSANKFLMYCHHLSNGTTDSQEGINSNLRLSDGALIVLDCIEGVSHCQTESLLRQAIGDRIKPVLFLNKLDRLILELQMDPEDAYQSFARTIDNVNVVIETYNDSTIAATNENNNNDNNNNTLDVSPLNGTVAFGSGLQSWGFTLSSFSRRYASKFGVEESKLRQRFWGDSWFDHKNKKWLHVPINENNETLQRTFCQFCLQPIYQLFDAIMQEKKEKLDKMLKALNITLTHEEQENPPKRMLRIIMSKFLPISDALLPMFVVHLPSPRQAQKYRAELLYSGEPNCERDPFFRGIKECDPNANNDVENGAPLMIYISKLIPVSNDAGRYYAFGRIFSGKVHAGQRVRIMGTNYKMGRSTDLQESRPVQRVSLLSGSFPEVVEELGCGNLVLLTGVDQYMWKNATISSAVVARPSGANAGATKNGNDDDDSSNNNNNHHVPSSSSSSFREPHPFILQKFATHPLIRVSLQPRNIAHLPKFIEMLKNLAKTDKTTASIFSDETGELVLAVPTERHLSESLKSLQREAPTIAFNVSEPTVAHRETVTATSSQLCMSKSPNRHNRLWCRASPLGEEVSNAMERGGICCADRPAKERADFLSSGKFSGWDRNSALKIWCYGPDGEGPNVVVESTKGCQYVNEVKDSVSAAWQWATKEGVLIEENMRGVRLDLEDCVFYADAIHRGAGQIIPTAKRVAYGSFLMAKPGLYEPVFEVEISFPKHKNVENSSDENNDFEPRLWRDLELLFSKRRGQLFPDERYFASSSTRTSWNGFLPIGEAFGFENDLQSLCGSSCERYHNVMTSPLLFDHWQLVAGDASTIGSPCHKIVENLRLRKGLKCEFPAVSTFLDTL